MGTGRRGLLLGVAILFGAGLALGLPVLRRLSQIRKATEETTHFCRSVRRGDELASVLERAKSGSSMLGAVTSAHPVLTDPEHDGTASSGANFNVVFEDREGEPTWPRYLIWKGPLYERVYCGLEPTADGNVAATHLGPVDDDAPGFFQDWLDE